jgi:hypothetical protein
MLYFGYEQRQKSVILCKDTAFFTHTQVFGQKSVKIHRFVSKVKKNSKGIARV